ncbi:Non-reducing end alpha-L-arabinofuranosidase BoGH43B [Halotydeus destructor]|nr:Non-reducing end alpha-L-arabinofuranosidase BoGH43B [Halotydeus destructor]
MKLYICFIVVCLAVLGTSGQELVNPLIDGADNPDPGVIHYNGKYYVVTTTMAQWNLKDKFRILESDDLQTWRLVGHVFSCGKNLPSWSNCDQQFWAPELHLINGQIRLYFASNDVSKNRLSVGVATADNITGPYTSTAQPIIQNLTTGYIDATVLHTDHGNYLAWKNEGNSMRPSEPTYIWAQPLASDGLSVVGSKVSLIREDLKWEGGLIEGPWFLQNGDYYYLFYSANGYCDEHYSVGVARSKTPLGPYEKKGDAILVSDSNFRGPGHCSVVLDTETGNHVMLYHAWRAGQVCGDHYRQLMGKTMSWSSDGWPYFE